MTRSEYNAITSEIADSDISAHDFRIVDDILRSHITDNNKEEES